MKLQESNYKLVKLQEKSLQDSQITSGVAVLSGYLPSIL